MSVAASELGRQIFAHTWQVAATVMEHGWHEAIWHVLRECDRMSFSDGRRVFTSYAAPRDLADLARIRHGRDIEATREKIARPSCSTPRRVKDWR